MPKPNEKLAESLAALQALQKGGRRVFRSRELSRTHRERLLRNGFLREVMKGWLMSSSPSARTGDSTPWCAWLRKVVNGYYQYHAVPGNLRQLSTFRQRINRLWYQVLARRSQRARKRWEALTPLFERWIPRPKVLHPYPQARFYATHPS